MKINIQKGGKRFSSPVQVREFPNRDSTMIIKNDAKPQLYVFAGPNGSGKSTFVDLIRKGSRVPILHINADNIAEQMKLTAYEAALEAENQRNAALVERKSFSVETVMSTYDKIEFLIKAKVLGYEIYLVFITTQDPLINVRRVEDRVYKGGHDVPSDKTMSRYDKSMKLLPEALKLADIARIYNNSFE
ncbi:MAG: zeta toxin family protein, partial [Nitrospirota bacterium]